MYNNVPRQISIANNYTKTISPTGSGRQTWQRNEKIFGNDGKQGIRLKTLHSLIVAMSLHLINDRFE